MVGWLANEVGELVLALVTEYCVCVLQWKRRAGKRGRELAIGSLWFVFLPSLFPISLFPFHFYSFVLFGQPRTLVPSQFIFFSRSSQALGHRLCFVLFTRSLSCVSADTCALWRCLGRSGCVVPVDNSTSYWLALVSSAPFPLQRPTTGSLKKNMVWGRLQDGRVGGGVFGIQNGRKKSEAKWAADVSETFHSDLSGQIPFFFASGFRIRCGSDAWLQFSGDG